MGWLTLHHCLFNNTAQAALDPHSFGEEEEGNTTQQVLQGPSTLAAKRGNICRASAVTRLIPDCIDAVQSLITWMGLAVLDKVQGGGQGVILWVPAMAVPVSSTGMPHGVTNTDHSPAWDFVVCGDLREKWMLLALPTAPGGLPW